MISAPTENEKEVLTMSLDITIKERKEFRCPDCGRLVTTKDIDEECSGGRLWYNFLELIGYYVPYEKRTSINLIAKEFNVANPKADALALFGVQSNFSPDEQKTYASMLERNSEKVGINISDLFG